MTTDYVGLYVYVLGSKVQIPLYIELGLYLYLIIECPQASNGSSGPSLAPVSKFTNSELFVLVLFPEPPKIGGGN